MNCYMYNEDNERIKVEIVNFKNIKIVGENNRNGNYDIQNEIVIKPTNFDDVKNFIKMSNMEIKFVIYDANISMIMPYIEIKDNSISIIKIKTYYF